MKWAPAKTQTQIIGTKFDSCFDCLRSFAMVVQVVIMGSLHWSTHWDGWADMWKIMHFLIKAWNLVHGYICKNKNFRGSVPRQKCTMTAAILNFKMAAFSYLAGYHLAMLVSLNLVKGSISTIKDLYISHNTWTLINFPRWRPFSKMAAINIPKFSLRHENNT